MRFVFMFLVSKEMNVFNLTLLGLKLVEILFFSCTFHFFKNRILTPSSSVNFLNYNTVIYMT